MASQDSAVTEPKVLKFKCSDNEIVEAAEPVAKLSTLFRDMLSTCGDEDDVVIPVEKADSHTLKKIVEWCEKHVDDPDVDKEIVLDDDDDYDFPEWDEEWIKKLSDVELIKVNMAADYLGIKMLLELGSKRFAAILKTLNIEETRERFKIKNDFTKEEEEELKKKFDFGDN